MGLSNVLKQHVIDTTSAMLVSTPAFAFIEKGLMGITTAESLHSRETTLGAFYLLGMGSIWARGRDLYFWGLRKACGKKQSEEFKHTTLLDCGYGWIFSTVYSLGLYKLNTADLDAVVAGTLIGGVLGVAVGALSGMATDCGRYLTGVGKPIKKRKFFYSIWKNKRRSSTYPLRAVAGAFALSTLVTATAYTIPDSYKGVRSFLPEHIESSTLEDAVQSEAPYALPEFNQLGSERNH